MSELLLGIDTSGSEGSIAIGQVDASGDVTQLQHRTLSGRHYADDVVPQLKLLFAQAHLALANFSAIVVVNGPGSFTGLRAGIGAAKALAEVGSLPLIAVSRLALLAATNAQGEASTIETVAVLDAGRGEYYLRLPSGGESLASADDVIRAAGSTHIRTSDVKVKEQLASLPVELVAPPSAFDAIRLAVPRFLAGAFDDVATLDANYVRRPYANFAGPV